MYRVRTSRQVPFHRRKFHRLTFGQTAISPATIWPKVLTVNGHYAELKYHFRMIHNIQYTVAVFQKKFNPYVCGLKAHEKSVNFFQ